MRKTVINEVDKLVRTESEMFVIGYLESVLAAALEQLPREKAERLIKVYFYDRPTLR